MESQLTNPDLRCVEQGSKPVFDNPENLQKIDARLARDPRPPAKPSTTDPGITPGRRTGV
jgi:hypothetical protein